MNVDVGMSVKQRFNSESAYWESGICVLSSHLAPLEELPGLPASLKRSQRKTAQL